MDVNRGAPVVAEAEIVIEAPPERVWKTLVDVARWPNWNPEVESVVLEGGTREGSVFRWKTNSGTITSTFQTIEPPMHVAWAGSPPEPAAEEPGEKTLEGLGCPHVRLAVSLLEPPGVDGLDAHRLCFRRRSTRVCRPSRPKSRGRSPLRRCRRQLRRAPNSCARCVRVETHAQRGRPPPMCIPRLFGPAPRRS